MTDPLTIEQTRQMVERQSPALIDFTRRMVSIPSLSGEEGVVAESIVAEMHRLRYDDVWTDDVGNIIGKIGGRGGPTVILNGHMDVVDPGPDDGWPYPAYSGQIVGDELWGRGSVDMKGPVAAMIHGAAMLKQSDRELSGDVLMTVAVQEEIGGLGSDFLVTHTTADAAIVGEPSSNQLRIGHRGRIELQVTFFGRSAHASAPHLGINPHFAAADFLQRLSTLTLAADPILGQSTIAPTLYKTDQRSANVIPSEATVYLDWRNVPSETRQHAVELIEGLAKQIPADRYESVEVKVTEQPRRTYTGKDREFASVFPPFATDESSPLAIAAKQVIETGTGNDAGTGVWNFATDGGHLSQAGIPVIGFGPGDDALAHTNQERISIAELKLATAIYPLLVLAMQETLMA